MGQHMGIYVFSGKKQRCGQRCARQKLGLSTKCTWEGEELEQVKKCRYLGLVLDEKLTWNHHINRIVDKCKKVLDMM